MDAYIIDGIRTPIGSYQGALAAVRPDDLGALVIKTLVEKNTQIPPSAYDDVIMGCANQAGEDNRNVARMSLLLAGLPYTVPGETVNRLCSSGLSAIIHANRAIKAGDGHVFIAGGIENMTRGPLVVSKPSSAFGTDSKMYDSSFGWRFVNPKMHALYGTDAMGETAENLVDHYTISRQDQDAFALHSQQKASAAQASGRLGQEIVPVEIPQRKGEAIQFSKDEFIKPATSMEGLAKLRPAFKKDGTITAASSSSINDGAAAMVLMRQSTATKLGCKPLARIVSHATHAQAPEWFATAPVGATQKALAKAGWQVNDVDLWEVNEAFAVVPMALMKELNVSHDKVNVNGGACALGHPIGASGARIIVTLMHALKAKGLKKGLATLCIGGGEGTAMAIELM